MRKCAHESTETTPNGHLACADCGLLVSTIRAMTPEPPPKPNDRPALWDLVIADMRARDEFGRAKYGTPLQPGNGRDALTDAYQEALDLCVYLRQAIYERDGR